MSDLEYLEKLYLPSRWSKRLSSDIIVQKHVEIITYESQKAREHIPNTLNIEYGTREKEKIDIFGTDLKNEAPIFVFVHGGYWQEELEESLKRDTYHFIAANLHKHGIKSIFVGYELCPKVTLSEIIEEIQKATKACIDYAKSNKSKEIYLTGYSAGCQLVATFFTNFTKTLSKENQVFIKAAILIAGIYDLCELPKTSINLPLKLDQDSAVELSPYRQDISTDVLTAFHIICAENDSPEFIRQSKEFHQKLKNVGLQSNFVIVDNVDHFDIVELLSKEDFEITQLILKIIIHS